MTSQMAEQVLLNRMRTTKSDPFSESRVAKLVQPEKEPDDAEWEYEYSATEMEVCSRSTDNAQDSAHLS